MVWGKYVCVDAPFVFVFGAACSIWVEKQEDYFGEDK